MFILRIKQNKFSSSRSSIFVSNKSIQTEQTFFKFKISAGVPYTNSQKLPCERESSCASKGHMVSVVHYTFQYSSLTESTPSLKSLIPNLYFKYQNYAGVNYTGIPQKSPVERNSTCASKGHMVSVVQYTLQCSNVTQSTLHHRVSIPNLYFKY